MLSLLLSKARPETQIKYLEFLHQICDRPLKGRGGLHLCVFVQLRIWRQGNFSESAELEKLFDGTLQVQHGARRTVIRAGEWSAYDVSKPYSVRNLHSLEQFAILLPKSQAAHVEILLRRFPNRGFPIAGMTQVLCSTLRTTLANSESVCDSVREEFGAALSELAKLAILEQLQISTAPTAQDNLRRRIETYIRRNLRDCSLTVDAIAASLRLSKRYVHKAFHDSGSGSTVSQFIWNARLNGCQRDLADPELRGHSITQIAFGWGFVNSAHFSRAFRDKFGSAPRAYRQAAFAQGLQDPWD